jgi:hypothetical protein
VARLTGWWDGAPVKTRLNDRPQADGYFQVAQSYRAGRVITVEGSYVGQDMTDTYAAIMSLRALQATGVPSVFRVTEPYWTLKATALLTGAPELPNRLFSPYFTFKFDVTTFDPNLYGDDEVFTTGVPMSGGGLLFPLGTTPTAYWDFGADGTSGRVSFTNTGTAITWPSLTAAGGLGAGFTATDVTTGQVVEFDRVIPVGSVVQIDQRTGRAWIDSPSNDVSGWITGRDFFAIGPGETHQIQFAGLGVVTGSPQFSLIAAPAYL